MTDGALVASGTFTFRVFSRDYPKTTYNKYICPETIHVDAGGYEENKFKALTHSVSPLLVNGKIARIRCDTILCQNERTYK